MNLNSRRKVFFFSFLAIFFLTSSISAGETVPPIGIRENTPQVHALINATLVLSPGQVIEKGTLVIRDGIIEAVGKNVKPPADARLWDMSGRTVYPGFIDPYSNYGMPQPPRRGVWGQDTASGRAPQMTTVGSSYWNLYITPQKSAAEIFTLDSSAAEKLRGQGITLVLTFPPGKIISGTAALVNTGKGSANDILEKPEVALHIGFESGSWGDETYPGSLMGVLALIRQSYLDADWYAQAHSAWLKDKSLPKPEQNDALARLSELKSVGVPVLLDAKDELAVLREVPLAQELGLTPILRGSNFEYRRLDEVKKLNVPIVLPLNFPEVPSVKTPEDALQVSLDQLRYWYLAPENPAKLNKAGVSIAFTGNGLKDYGTLLDNLRLVVERGLDKESALLGITLNPAKILGIADRFGTLSSGKVANLTITDGDLFDKKTKILETWVYGKRYEIKTLPLADTRGTWNVKLSSRQTPSDTIKLEIKGELSVPSGSIVKQKKAILSNVQISGSAFSFNFSGDSLGFPGIAQMSSIIAQDTLFGQGVWPDGSPFTWTAFRTSPYSPEPDTVKKKPFEPLKLSTLYPDGEFGLAQYPPVQPKVLAVKNATIWTCGPQGIIENGTLLVKEGKIASVSKNIAIPKEALIIDAAGRHVTPGLIDCHSHTAIEGDVNEGTQTVTAEVRIGDVVDANDINIYRQLAGGLTCANLLHGSANAIGGQNQVIKLRWGGTPEELKYKQAPPGIKFALGENPKQSNWGDKYTTRYPQTRMGVEQIIRDEFQAAKEYEQQWHEYNKTKKGIPPRKDLELEAIVEVLNGRRLVHCHSYRQDEILMLMRLAEEYGFRIATFQHVLEGYMVADALAQHGAGASCFSDWWAYKFEVYDAIPYNGALMQKQGVIVSFNSDSNEMARRLNTEAAKAVKYGGLSPEEALKFVTINPAIQLRIDQWVGSLEAGKDADFTLWSGDPLSTYSMCLQTWIEGRKYFDRDGDLKMRELVQKERALLIQRALADSDGQREEGAKPWGRKPPYSCHGIIEEEELR